MGPNRALRDLVYELEDLRRRVPEAIYEGRAEEVLRDAYALLRAIIPVERGLVFRPYTGLVERVRLLAQLAMALRLRMIRAGTPYILGTDYFIEKLDDIISETRILAGLHPYLPLNDKSEYRVRG